MVWYFEMAILGLKRGPNLGNKVTWNITHSLYVSDVSAYSDTQLKLG